MKNTVFWDVAASRYCVNRGFLDSAEPAHAISSLADFLYNEDRGDIFLRNVVNIIYTRRYVPEEGISNSHRRENLKSYN
jgi:hypothetical protein